MNQSTNEPVNLPPSVRLFFAIDLDQAARTELSRRMETAEAHIRASASSLIRDVRWTAPQNLHVTLKFLGDVEEDRVPLVLAAGADAVAQEPAARCRIHSVGSFPSHRGLVVVRAAVDEGRGLSALAGKLESALERVGYERERRPFFSHVTLARVRGKHAARTVLRSLEHPPLDVITTAAALTLFRSDLQPRGPVYTPLAQWALEDKKSAS